MFIFNYHILYLTDGSDELSASGIVAASDYASGVNAILDYYGVESKDVSSISLDIASDVGVLEDEVDG